MSCVREPAGWYVYGECTAGDKRKPWPSWKKLVCRELHNISVCQLVYHEKCVLLHFQSLFFSQGYWKRK